MRASHPPALSRRPDTVWVPKSKYLRASLVAASRVISTGVTSPTAPAATLRNNTHPRHAQPETYLMIRRLPRKINGRVMATRRRWGGFGAARQPCRSSSGRPETEEFNGIFLENKRLYVRLDIERVEIPQPPVRRDDRPVGTEQHFVLEQSVRVSDQDWWKILG